MSTKSVPNAQRAIEARNLQAAKCRALQDRLYRAQEKLAKVTNRAWKSLPENCAISFENCNGEVDWELVVR